MLYVTVVPWRGWIFWLVFFFGGVKKKTVGYPSVTETKKRIQDFLRLKILEIRGKLGVFVSGRVWDLAGETCKYSLFSPRKLAKISNLTNIFRWVETTN